MYSWINEELEAVLLGSNVVSSRRQNIVQALKSQYFNSTLMNMSADDLVNELKRYVVPTDFNLNDGFLVLEALERNKYNRSLIGDLLFFSNTTVKYPKLLKNIPDYVESDTELPLSLFIDESLIDILKGFSIVSLNDFLALSNASKSLLLIKNFIAHYRNLFKLCHVKVNRTFDADLFSHFTYKAYLENLMKMMNIKPHHLGIVINRGYLTSDRKLTLDQLGSKNNVTRERVRQVENQTIKKIVAFYNKVDIPEKYIFDYCFNCCCDDSLLYCEVDRFMSLVKNDDYAALLILSAYNDNSPYRLDPEYGIIYDKRLTTIDELVNQALNRLSKIFSAKKQKLSSFEARVVKKFYVKKGNDSYVIKGFTAISMLNYFVDKYFPDGFSISQLHENEDYLKLISHMKEDGGFVKGAWTPRNVAALFERDPEATLIDRGRYQLTKKCATLPTDLLNRIIKYISENAPIIYYITIYTHFEDELKALNIDNYFYLKGLLDPHLPIKFHSKRNYIQIGDSKVTAVDEVISYMRSFKGAFTLEHLKERYKGVKTYTFMQYAYIERKKGLMFLPSYHFCYIGNVGISDETKNEYYHFLKDLFKEFHVQLLTSAKVFTLLKERRSDILEGLKIVNDGYILFSVTEQLFADKLFFRRPYFCLSDNAHDDHLMEFIYSRDQFDRETIARFCKLTGVKVINYLAIISKCETDYIQVDKFSFIRRDVFDINDGDLETIKQYLLNSTQNTGKILATQLKDYPSLSNFSYRYNPYLFAGIARTLLPSTFEVIPTANEFQFSDYLIVRREGE